MDATVIVLGAGRGERLGGPKALLLVEGRTLVELHVARAREAGVRDVVAVVRPAIAATVRSLLGDSALVAASEAPDPFGSLRVGLEAADADASPIVIVTPIDALPAATSTWRALLDAIAAGAPAAVPIYRARGGHPVALARAALSLEGASTLREVLARAGAVRVACDDAAVVTDLDTPDDVVAATGGAPAFSIAR